MLEWTHGDLNMAAGSYRPRFAIIADIPVPWPTKTTALEKATFQFSISSEVLFLYISIYFSFINESFIFERTTTHA